MFRRMERKAQKLECVSFVVDRIYDAVDVGQVHGRSRYRVEAFCFEP